ncbi:MAG: hypothetical protein HYR63_27610 [Proteobacteria bacterium]|nr:hypothetical protein [Pseudomonadota bacterium]MBI3497855.1 hypothetical protein [Pseudomonadota bacterium]
MAPIIFALQYAGPVKPIAKVPGVLRVKLTASSCRIETAIGPKGVASSIAKIPGGKAVLDSIVTVTGEATFIESGTLTFGRGGTTLTFSTVGQAAIGPSADPKLTSGAAIWKVTGGTGQFKGATGYVIGNFFATDKGEATDTQVAVIFPAKK